MVVAVSMETMVKTDMEAGGIWNEGLRCLSMDLTCCRVKVPCWADAVVIIIPVSHIGAILIIDFSSSTRCTVLSLHRLGDLSDGDDDADGHLT